MQLHKIIATLLTALLCLTAAGQQGLQYKKGVPVSDDPATMRENLTKAGAKYLDIQQGTIYFRDKFAGLPCLVQYPWEQNTDGMEITLAFQSRETWKQLEKDYDKIYAYLEKTYGKPQTEEYCFLHSSIDPGFEEMEELLNGHCDWTATWHFEDGDIQLSIGTSATGECFNMLIIKKKK